MKKILLLLSVSLMALGYGCRTGDSEFDQIGMDSNKKIIEEDPPYYDILNITGTVYDMSTDLPVSGAKIQSVLETVFTGDDGRYKITVPEESIFMCSKEGYPTYANLARYQNQVINIRIKPYVVTLWGYVYDSRTNEVLPTAMVGVKGASSYTYTDLDGKYSLPNVHDNDIVVFACFGYKIKEVSADGYVALSVGLDPEI